MTRIATRSLPALLLVAATLFFAMAPSSAHAASSADDYSMRLRQAGELVKSALPDVGEDAAADALVSRVRELLPAGERVSAGGGEIVVDDAALAADLDALAGANTPDDRRDAAQGLSSHLEAMQAALGQLPGTPVASDREALARIVAEERIGDSGMPDWLTKLEEQIREWIDKLMPDIFDAVPEPVYKWVFPVMSAIAVLLAALLVWRLWTRGVSRRDGYEVIDGDGKTVPVVAVAEDLPQDVLGHADAEAAQGRYRDAVRALFGGAARELGERGVLSRTRTRTTAELLRDVGSGRPSLAGPLGDMAEVFEPSWYGHHDPGDVGFAAARTAYVTFMARLAGGDAQ
ncbi:MAG: DUF4129 domain-containing protein [Coriobacteriia bacterium]|nr:DUF4129 domain-containing protein [Coriobacteriia bacterium]MBN2822500.1 DUF4129 domain-containing protein [Coriobacteriia bacterium]